MNRQTQAKLRDTLTALLELSDRNPYADYRRAARFLAAVGLQLLKGKARARVGPHLEIRE